MKDAVQLFEKTKAVHAVTQLPKSHADRLALQYELSRANLLKGEVRDVGSLSEYIMMVVRLYIVRSPWPIWKTIE